MSRSYLPPKPNQPPVAPQPGRPRKRGRGGKVVLISAAVALLLAGGVYLFVKNLPPPADSDTRAPAQPRASASTTAAPLFPPATTRSVGIMRTDFYEPKPFEVTPELTAELQGVCNRFAASVKSRDRTDIALWIDAQRTLEEMRRFATVRDPNRRDDGPLQRQMATLISEGMASAPALQFNKTQVIKIQPLPTPGEVVVSLRAWSAVGQMKFRWWFRKTGAVWRMYDLEELDSGVHVYHAMAAETAATIGEQGPAWVTRIRPLVALHVAVEQKDLAGADRLLAELEGAGLPRELDAKRLALMGATRSARGDHAEAMRLYAQAESMNADLTVLPLFRAQTHNANKRPAEAMAAAKRYIDRVGDTARGCYELGVALEAQGQQADAAVAFRRGLVDDPKSVDNRTGLARVSGAAGPATRPATTKP